MRLFKTLQTLTLALLLCATAAKAETYYAMNKGSWFDPENWTINSDASTYDNPNRAVPGAGDNVVIRNGESIVLDQVMDNLASLTIDGTLEIRVPEGVRYVLTSTDGKIKIDGSGTIRMPGWEDTSLPGWDGGDKGGWNLDVPGDGMKPFISKGTVVFTGNGRMPSAGASQKDAKYKFSNNNEHLQFNNVVVEKGAKLVMFDRININGTFHVKGRAEAWFGARGVFGTYNNIRIDQGGVFTGANRSNEKEKQIVLKGDLICDGKLDFCSVLNDPMNKTAGWKITLHFMGDQDQEIRFGGDNQECHLGRLEFEKIKNANAVPEVRIYSTVPGKVKFREYTEDASIKESQLIEFIKEWTGASNKKYSCQVRLVLGENIVINRINRGFDKNKGDKVYNVGGAVQTFLKDDPAFYIPEGSEVVVAGADVNLGSTGDNVGFIHLQGKLNIMAGSLTIDDGSHGIIYSGTKGEFSIEDGLLTTTSIYPLNDDGYNAINFTQSGGKISFTKARTNGQGASIYINDQGGNVTSKINFFRMTGGEMVFDRSTGSSQYGARLFVEETHQVVTGGKMVVKDIATSGRDFHIYSNVPFYDLEVSNSLVYFDQELVVKHNLTLNDNVQLNVQKITVGGDLSMQSLSNYWGSWVFDGSTNTTINDRTKDGYTFGNVVIAKEKNTVGVKMSNNKPFSVSGNLTMKGGQLSAKTILTGYNQTEIAQEGGSFEDADFDLGSKYVSVRIVTDVTMKSLIGLSDARPLYIDGYRLKIMNATFTNAQQILFVTNGEPNEGGLVLPLKAGQKQCYPIGVQKAGTWTTVNLGAEITSAGEAGYFGVEPGAGAHFGLAESYDTGKKSDVLPYYWRIGWEGENQSKGFAMTFYHNHSDKLSGGAMYGCFFRNTEWDYYDKSTATNTQAKNGTSGHLDFTKFDPNGAYGKTWTGDVTYGKKQEVKDATFYSLPGKPANYWDDGYAWTTDTVTNAPAGKYPGPTDRVIIRSGHAVHLYEAADKQPRLALLLEVRKGGKLMVDPNAKGYEITEILGEGTIQYKYASGLSNWIKAKYTNFSNRKNACIEFEMQTNTVGGNNTLPITTFPNLTFTSDERNDAYTAQFANPNGQPIVVNGNLELKNVQFETSGFNNGLGIEGDFKVDAKSSVDANVWNGANITIKGDVLNQGSMMCRGGQATFHGNIENNGTMELTGWNMQWAGTKSVVIKGNPITIGTFRLNKDNAKATVEVKTQLIGSDWAKQIKTDLVSGTLHLNVEKAEWLMMNKDYGQLDIYEDATLIVDNKSKLRVMGWRGSEQNNRVSIWLAGGLVAQGGSEIDATVNFNGAPNCGIAYWNTGHSMLKLLTGSTLTAAFIAPDNVKNATIEYYQSGGTVTLLGGALNRTYGYSATFDIQGGKLTTLGNAVIDIKDFCHANGLNGDENNNFINLVPTTANMSAKTLFKVFPNSSWGCATIRSNYALPNLTVVGGRKGPVLVQDLTVDGELIVDGMIRTSPDANHNHFNLTVKGTATFANSGSFETDDLSQNTKGTATLILAGQNPTVKMGKASDVLNSCNIVVKCSGTATLPLTNVRCDFVVETGNVNLTAPVGVQGNLRLSKSSTIGGNTVTMTGDSKKLGSYNPVLECRGTIETLKIQTQKMIDATAQQDEAIKISKELNLDKAYLNIGVNELMICKEAKITGNLGKDGYIWSTFDETSRGVTFQLASTSLTGTIPFAHKTLSAEDYMPVDMDFNFAKVAADAQVTIKPMATKHPVLRNVKTDVLDFFWAVQYQGVTASKTDDCGIVAHIAKSHAPNFGESTNPYKRGVLPQGAVQWRVLDGGMTLDGNMISIDFPYAGDCDYTISRELPDIMGYATVADGYAFGDEIWKLCDVNGNVKGGNAVKLTRTDMVGVQLFVNHKVTVSENNIQPYVTTIGSDGTIDFGETKNHNLGRLYGSGTMKQAHGKLPSTKTLDFFGEAGGTVEFYGTANNKSYDIISTYSRVRNLKVTDVDARVGGSVTVIYGDLTVSKGAYLALGTNVELMGNLKMESDTKMENTTGDAGILKFEGKSVQHLDVPQQGIKVNMVVDGAGISLEKSLDLTTTMTLTKGNVILNEGEMLTVADGGVLSGGSSASYIDGALKMKTLTGTAKRFPVGNDGRYGELSLRNVNPSGYYVVHYYNAIPDDSQMDDDIEAISNNEYWSIVAPKSGAVAQPQIRWDALSGVSPSTVCIAMQQPGKKWSKIATTGLGTNSNAGSAYVKSNQQVSATAQPTLVTFCFEHKPDDDGCIWTGIDGNDWFSEANWKNFRQPSSVDKVTIGKTPNNPVIDHGTVKIGNKLTIEPGATLTLDAASLTVESTGEISYTNRGQFIVQHRHNKAASVVTKKTIVNALVRREMETLRSYYVGSSNATGQIDNSKDDKNYMAVMRHDEADDSWTQLSGEPNLAQISTIGKFGNRGEYWNLEQIGNIEPLGKKTYSLKTMSGKSYGWHLVYNHAPVTMNLKKGKSAISFDANVAPVIWFRTQTADGTRIWQTYNVALGEGANLTFDDETTAKMTDKAIAPYQAFYVQTQNGTADKVATGTVTIDMTGQTHIDNVGLKSTDSEEEANDVLRVSVVSDENELADEAVMVFRDGGSIYSVWSDAEKKLETDSYNAIAVQKESKLLAIASLPDAEEVFGTMIEMYVSVPATATEATISVSGIDAMDVEDVVLIDRIADVEVSLKRENSYIFAPSVLDAQRFAIVLKKPERVEAEGGTQTGTKDLDTELRSVERYDIMGRRATEGERGVVIEKRNYTDGTSEAQKTLRK